MKTIQNTNMKRLIGGVGDSVGWVVIFVVAILLMSLCVQHASNSYFATDELCHLLGGYRDKLQSEGRWINFILFPGLKLINGHVALIASMVSFSYFVYACARNVSDRRTAVLVAGISLMAPSFNQQMDWPCTTLLMILFLGWAAMVHKSLGKLPFFVLFGVLFAGVLQSAYMLLPLLFLDEKSKRGIVKVIGCWILGYIVGFAVAELATYAICGSLITLADWREPHYVTDLPSLIDNVTRVWQSHVRHMGRAKLLLYAIFGLALIASVWCHRKKFFKTTLILLLFVLVLLSVYAQALMAGLAVATRTILSIHVGLVLLSLYAFQGHRHVLYMVLGVVAWVYFTYSSECLKYLHLTRKEWIEDFASIQVSPGEVSHVVLLSDSDDFLQVAEDYRKRGVFVPPMQDGPIAYHWNVAPFARGFYSILGQTDGKQLLLERGINLDTLQLKRKGAFEFALEKGVLVLKFARSSQ